LQKAQAALAPPEVYGQAVPNWNVSPCRANPRTTITTSVSSSIRREASTICDCLDSSEFANDRACFSSEADRKMLSFAPF
jgi:hypothetical protein